MRRKLWHMTPEEADSFKATQKGVEELPEWSATCSYCGMKFENVKLSEIKAHAKEHLDGDSH